MIGVVVIAHHPIASALAQGASHVYTCAPERASTQFAALDVGPSDAVPDSIARARDLIRSVDTGQGVLVLTDAFGATPGNVAAQLVDAGKVAVVAGVNLPMLLRTLCHRDKTLADAVEKAVTGGQQAVMQVAATTVQNQGNKSQGHDYARLHDQQ